MIRLKLKKNDPKMKMLLICSNGDVIWTVDYSPLYALGYYKDGYSKIWKYLLEARVKRVKVVIPMLDEEENYVLVGNTYYNEDMDEIFGNADDRIYDMLIGE